MGKCKQLARLLLRYAELAGFNPLKLLRSARGLPFYLRDKARLRSQMAGSVREFPFGTAYPCLEDRFAASGEAKYHYFHQDLLVARRVFARNPRRHVDIGSRIDGFVAHLASFRPVEVFDVRPLRERLPNIEFRQADLMGTLPAEFKGCCDSLSSLHALEHFGLGRYGDPVDSEGWRKGFFNMHSILEPGGVFYFSVPIGPQRIEFNAHRVFAVDFLLKCFSGKFEVRAFSYVDDEGNLHENVKLDGVAAANSFDCSFGCGIFELERMREPSK